MRYGLSVRSRIQAGEFYFGASYYPYQGRFRFPFIKAYCGGMSWKLLNPSRNLTFSTNYTYSVRTFVIRLIDYLTVSILFCVPKWGTTETLCWSLCEIADSSIWLLVGEICIDTISWNCTSYEENVGFEHVYEHISVVSRWIQNAYMAIIDKLY